jgi:hypothetical protein
MKFSSSGGTIRPEGENFFLGLAGENEHGKIHEQKRIYFEYL